ncbi:CAF17-like 4Fe-4S cluster assembly/insertion protein YgfZ [Coxiella endosymbiont of Amblyomma americanum]|uniref:CAF17-like 4Fe-4S cluster assembly/insertion protein YgfZ n=1 Tax=Coxiella endosymbiont of Amblyomma americanum TaxID=325775 RepID=UPI0005820A63|nr:folate-binding protein YgfZ [Coxiella endosymbiont of Amblyomma americanum]AJC50491.1 folate-binding protein YgfZ [Coxiella endosymbiont of Amblyomma americanum]AUJ58828.1 folate-binding protein YgfZ [Coxiella-like endosymbiont of Amblyomma americanum]
MYTIPSRLFSILVVSGADSGTFLQNQVTCDLYKITETYGSFSACCDYKGRVISDFYVVYQKGYYCILLQKSTVVHTIDHLKKYSIFSKVELTITHDWSIKLPLNIQIMEMGENSWKDWNIRIGLAWIYPQTKAKFIPQMLNLQKWDALNFTKGCYIGQEVIARTHYLGKLKRHLYRAEIISQISPKPGDELKNQDEQNVGIIVEAALQEEERYRLLAVIQDTTIEYHGHSILFGRTVLTNITLCK